MGTFAVNKYLLLGWEQLLQGRELSWPGLHRAKDLSQLRNTDKEKVSLKHLCADQDPAGQESKNTEQGYSGFTGSY